MLHALIPQIEKEVKDALTKQGIPADVKVISDVLTIRLSKDEVVNTIKKQIPPPYNANVEVEASDIIIKVRLT